MKQELKDKWIAALRSGEYKQDGGVLYASTLYGGSEEEVFCCLGVLAHVAGKSKEELSKHNLLPREWVEEFGLTKFAKERGVRGIDGNWDIFIGNKDLTLANLNDDGTSFKELADMIENLIDAE